MQRHQPGNTAKTLRVPLLLNPKIRDPGIWRNVPAGFKRLYQQHTGRERAVRARTPMPRRDDATTRLGGRDEAAL